MNKTFSNLGIQIPQIYLPRAGIDLARWAVVSCDQFTSEPEYWKQVAEIVGDAPSTLNLIFPEVYLHQPGETERIQRIQAAMQAYLEQGIIQPVEGLVYVERTVNSVTRKGLILNLDLEQYSYLPGAQSLVRATEGTILERLPPRMKIRQGALLELPHILVLIDDPGHTVIEPLAQARERLMKLYDFDLMLDSGHLAGYLVNDPQLEAEVVRSLSALANPEEFAHKYKVGIDRDVLLYAMGDGNHSLATAKAIWEKMKPDVGLDHPARYALVEVENIHDEALVFEPIHRVLFGLHHDPLQGLQDLYQERYVYRCCLSPAEMAIEVDQGYNPIHRFGVVSADGYGVVEIHAPNSNLPVGTLQTFLDVFFQGGGAEKIDYVHGEEVLCRLGAQPGNMGFYLPAMGKDSLFQTVILDGALPRKTFSMGEASEKRFYMESRRIA